MWKLPSLKSVSIVECAYLSPDITKMVLAGMEVSVLAEPQTLHKLERSYLSYQRDLKSISGKSELYFESESDIESDSPIAFIAEEHSGDRWLIGAFEPPFPKVEIKHETGDNPKSVSKYSCSVTWDGVPAKVTVWLESDGNLPVS